MQVVDDHPETIRTRPFETVDPVPAAVLAADDETLFETGLRTWVSASIGDAVGVFHTAVAELV